MFNVWNYANADNDDGRDRCCNLPRESEDSQSARKWGLVVGKISGSQLWRGATGEVASHATSDTASRRARDYVAANDTFLQFGD